MEENTEEENKEELKKESGLPPTENAAPVIPNPQPETPNPQPEIPNPHPITPNLQPETDPAMEVHHHSHAGHGKKTWKSYFWEFLMLFLAVFCGFLAEYKLEHVIEHQREKQYIESLVADLKSDQQVLTQHTAAMTCGISMMDSLTAILNASTDISYRTGELYYLARLAPRLEPLSTNSRTFEQLKNSGNFRLIRKMEASNKIMTYYEKFPQVRMLESINDAEFTQYKNIAAKIFDPAIFLKMEGPEGQIMRTTDNPALRTTDRELLQELSVFGVYMSGTKRGIVASSEELKRTGAELISFLEKEYEVK